MRLCNEKQHSIAQVAVILVSLEYAPTILSPDDDFDFWHDSHSLFRARWIVHQILVSDYRMEECSSKIHQAKNTNCQLK